MEINVDPNTCVRWQLRAGHYVDGTWIHDDAPDQHTGPFGKIHVQVLGDEERVVCGKRTPAHAELVPGGVRVEKLCHVCLRVIFKPYL